MVCICSFKIKHCILLLLFLSHRKFVVFEAREKKRCTSFPAAFLCVTEIHSSHIISFIATMLIAFIPRISFVYLKNAIKGPTKPLQCWAGGWSICLAHRIMLGTHPAVLNKHANFLFPMYAHLFGCDLSPLAIYYYSAHINKSTSEFVLSKK